MHKLSLIKRCCPNFWRGGAGQQKGWGQRGRAQKREERDLSIQVLGEMERGGEGRRYQVPKCAHFGGTKKGRKFDNLRSQAHSLLLSSESLLLSLSRARFLSLKTLLSSFRHTRAFNTRRNMISLFLYSLSLSAPLSTLSSHPYPMSTVPRSAGAPSAPAPSKFLKSQRPSVFTI